MAWSASDALSSESDLCKHPQCLALALTLAFSRLLGHLRSTCGVELGKWAPKSRNHTGFAISHGEKPRQALLTYHPPCFPSVDQGNSGRRSSPCLFTSSPRRWCHWGPKGLLEAPSVRSDPKHKFRSSRAPLLSSLLPPLGGANNALSPLWGFLFHRHGQSCMRRIPYCISPPLP